MQKRRDLDRHLQSLHEIGEIMNAMRNLALMETHKLARLAATQHRVVATIEAAAADLLAFHPDLARADEPVREVGLILGSERGFCGDYNEALLRALPPPAPHGGDPALVTVGSKIGARLAGDPRVVARLEGPTALEQVESVLLRVIGALTDWQAGQSPPRALSLTVFHHGAQAAGELVTRLDPFTRWTPAPPRAGYPPLLNLEPPAYFRRLAEHYLNAALHGVFYRALTEENEQRMRHMDFALRRIEETSSALARRRDSLRQEEITEEIEVIMLNIETLRAGAAP
jgi:F-type H+-transporting ATPase subunit gamma